MYRFDRGRCWRRCSMTPPAEPAATAVAAGTGWPGCSDRGVAGGLERGPVEDEPAVGDLAVLDGHALGARGAFHRHGLGVVHDQRGLVVTERSEEHTSELQSRRDLVCRLLLE